MLNLRMLCVESFYNLQFASSLAEDFHRMNDYVELAESTEIDEEDLSDPERAQATATRDTGIDRC